MSRPDGAPTAPPSYSKTGTEPVRQPPPHADGAVPIDESPLAPRARRPMDVARLVATAAAALLTVGIAMAALNTGEGIEQDVAGGTRLIPSWLVAILALVTGLVGAVIPLVLLVGSLARRRFRTAAEQLVAGLVASVIALLSSAWISGPAPDRLRAAFEPVDAGTLGAAEVPGYLAFLVAAVTIRGMVGRPWLLRGVSLAVAGGALSGVLDGATTPQGAVLAVLLGRLVGLGMRIGSGVPTHRPRGPEVVATLQELGLHPTALAALPEDTTRHYVAETATGGVDIMVLDRDREGAGFLTRGWRTLRTRGDILPREELTLRGATDQRTLAALAFASAGVRTPRLLASSALGPDAVMLVYEHVPGRLLAEFPRDALGDAVVADIWAQVGRMQTAGLAHRRVSGRAFRLDDEHRVWVVDRSGAEVAAGDLAGRTDVAQALVETALLVGPDRAVRAAAEAIGAQRTGRALPLLQPIALDRSTRQALKDHPDLLAELRASLSQTAALDGAAEIRLERFRPRVLLTFVSALVAAYLVVTQFTGVDIVGVVRTADAGWILVAVAAFALTYVGAALALLGFVTHPVGMMRTLGAQLALSFVRLVAPSTLGNVAVNVRLLTRAGVPVQAAGASVAASQAAAVIITVPLLVVLSLTAGRIATAGIRPSATVGWVIVGALVVVALLALVPAIRARGRVAWESFALRGLPSLLDAVQDPRKLAVAVGGNLLQTFMSVACFWFCIHALGATISFSALAVVWLTGNAVGTVVPTPGGLGAVEAALTAGLGAAGLPPEVAVPSVILFRLVSFWVPILPGWLAWTRLQKAGVL